MQKSLQKTTEIAANQEADVVKITTMQIIPMLPEHWPSVKKIYEEGIATGNATFQTTAPDWQEWDAGHVKNSRLVCIENNEVQGWAALTAVSGRCVYAGVAEVSVYVAAAARGKGIGKKLLQALIEESEKNNFWTLQAGIFPENKNSVKIHEDCGFRVIGRREKIGQMNGIWRDTLLLERRSTITGI
jgi:phosphinothricin acetyltransferase